MAVAPLPASSLAAAHRHPLAALALQVSLELSRLSNLDDSLAQFFAQLDQPAEGAGAEMDGVEGAGAGAGRLRPARQLSRDSSGISRLLQQVLEAGGVQALEAPGGGGAGAGGGSLLSNRSWLEQLEGALSLLPTLSSLPNWQPDLEIPSLDVEGALGEAGEGGGKQVGGHLVMGCSAGILFLVGAAFAAFGHGGAAAAAPDILIIGLPRGVVLSWCRALGVLLEAAALYVHGLRWGRFGPAAAGLYAECLDGPVGWKSNGSCMAGGPCAACRRWGFGGFLDECPPCQGQEGAPEAGRLVWRHECALKPTVRLAGCSGRAQP